MSYVTLVEPDIELYSFMCTHIYIHIHADTVSKGMQVIYMNDTNTVYTLSIQFALPISCIMQETHERI